MALIRSNTFRELKHPERMAVAARAFVDWVAALPEDDPRLFRPSLSLREDGVEREKLGPYARFHTWSFMLGAVAQAEHRTGKDVTGVFEELDRVLEAHEAHVRNVQEEGGNTSTVEEETRGLARGYSRAGEAAAITRCYERALRYFGREEALAGRLEMHGPVYRAAALCALGRATEARERLGAISGRLVTSGQWRTMFEELEAFDAIRDDPEVIAVIDGWRKAEAAGRHG